MSMMENTTRPQPPNLSEGCFDCGGGMNEILQSQTRGPVSVALCSQCQAKPKLESTKPFNSR